MRRPLTRWLALLCGCLLLGLATPAAATEADRWLSLLAAVPSLPATPSEALTKISARRVHSEEIGRAHV